MSLRDDLNAAKEQLERNKDVEKARAQAQADERNLARRKMFYDILKHTNLKVKPKDIVSTVVRQNWVDNAIPTVTIDDVTLGMYASEYQADRLESAYIRVLKPCPRCGKLIASSKAVSNPLDKGDTKPFAESILCAMEYAYWYSAGDCHGTSRHHECPPTFTLVDERSGAERELAGDSYETALRAAVRLLGYRVVQSQK